MKKKFIKSAIGNHLYSFISEYEGMYDSTAKTITFESEFEPVPGTKTKDRFLFVFMDNDHYKWEYYQEEKGKFRLGTEITFIRSTAK